MTPKIKIQKDWLEKFCKENHIVKLALFGSVISDHFTDCSDIDILVEFEEQHTPGLFKFIKMKDTLSQLLERNVDLRTPEDISNLFRNEVLQKSYLLYRHEKKD